MDWERAIREERAALMRIATLLCALADIAEIAAGRSPALRGFLLWLLRHAEDVALDFVFGDPDVWPDQLPAGPATGCPEEALRLAVSFNAMARELERQARLLLSMRDGEVRAAATPVSSGALAALHALSEGLSMVVASGSTGPHPAPDTS